MRALTVASELAANRQAMIVGREFAHIHPQPNGGGSLHLRLPPDQALEVVDRGWGEWHPFAVDGTMPGMVLVYAPDLTRISTSSRPSSKPPSLTQYLVQTAASDGHLHDPV